MKDQLLIAQIIVSVLLIVAILLQQRGTALGSAFGGTEEVYSTRRGIQKKLMYGTIVLVIAFIVLALLNLLS
ncbi:MAG: preprotein translocase subunit SecG [Parcubacteria group bacterium]|jgi:protein translocase SecG subunit|nr:preprotein translocase subunit SecG [Parcubacteria group bacterium]